jgi:hypothetical protein
MYMSPASYWSLLACAAPLLLGCGARTELGVALSSDAGDGSGECPELARPPSCPDAGNPWLLFYVSMMSVAEPSGRAC